MVLTPGRSINSGGIQMAFSGNNVSADVERKHYGSMKIFLLRVPGSRNTIIPGTSPKKINKKYERLERMMCLIMKIIGFEKSTEYGWRYNYKIIMCKEVIIWSNLYLWCLSYSIWMGTHLILHSQKMAPVPVAAWAVVTDVTVVVRAVVELEKLPYHQ